MGRGGLQGVGGVVCGGLCVFGDWGVRDMGGFNELRGDDKRGEKVP